MDLTAKIDSDFVQLAAFPDDRIDLVQGAILIAKAAYPDLDESLMSWIKKRPRYRLKPSVTGLVQ